MQQYPVKRGFTKDLESTMIKSLKVCFGVEPKHVGDHYMIQYGALKVLDVSIGSDGKSLIVKTESDTSVSDDAILDTNKRFRQYLDMVTGYTTKERVKKAKTVE
ncbi:MAG TPA: DUF5611 family protein [Methanoregulaceae archaeon]|nr:DUF5611 family protein [Methanoregulaceae archaeon]